MKKILFGIIIVLAFTLLVGCGKNNDAHSEKNLYTQDDTEIKDEIEETKEPVEIDVEYQEISWPSFGLSELLPEPSWSSNGEIEYDMSQALSINIGYSTSENFEEYVVMCREKGFTDIRTNNSKEYCAFNEEGYSIYIEHREGNVLHIWIGAPMN